MVQVDDTQYDRQDPNGPYTRFQDTSFLPTLDRGSLSVEPLRNYLGQKSDFVSESSVDGYETVTATVSRDEYPDLLGTVAGTEGFSPVALGILLEDNDGGDLTSEQLPENLQLSVTSSGDVVTGITVVAQGMNDEGPVDMTFTTTFDRFNGAPSIVAPKPEETVDDPGEVSSTEEGADSPTS